MVQTKRTSLVRSENLFGIIDTDIFCPVSIHKGHQYVARFIDDCSWYGYLIMINPLLNMFNIYKTKVEHQLDKKLKLLKRTEVVNIMEDMMKPLNRWNSLLDIYKNVVLFLIIPCLVFLNKMKLLTDDVERSWIWNEVWWAK